MDVTARRFERGDMLTLIKRTFDSAGIEIAPVRRSYPTHPKYTVEGKVLDMKGLIRRADELRIQMGMEPLGHAT